MNPVNSNAKRKHIYCLDVDWFGHLLGWFQHDILSSTKFGGIMHNRHLVGIEVISTFIVSKVDNLA
jgi:hypothetical protein